MRRGVFFIIPLLILCACNRAELIDVVELGAVEKEIFVPQGASEGSMTLLTNVPYEARIVSGEDWLTLRGSGMMPVSRTEIPYKCSVNQSFKRTAKVTFASGTRVDTVFVRQEGALADRISVETKSYNVPAAGGTYSTAVECFRYPDALLLDISVSNAVQATYSDGLLQITVAPATARDPKTYTVTIYYIDGWGERASATVTINQEARN